MNTCFSTLGCTEKSLPEVLALARQYHIDALEFRGLEGTMAFPAISAFSPTQQAHTRTLCAEAGVRPLVLGTSCQFHQGVGWARMLTEGVETIRLAHELGAPFIRVFGNYFRPDAPTAVNRVIQGIRELIAATNDTDVAILLEIHADFNRAAELLDVIHGVDSPRFGLIWDVYHSDGAYGDQWRSLYRQIRPWIRHVHLKDYHRDSGQLCLPGDGDLPLRDILDQLAADRYDGYISLEWERKWHPELPDIETALECFAAYF